MTVGVGDVGMALSNVEATASTLEAVSLIVTEEDSLGTEEAVKEGDSLSKVGGAELYEALRVGSAASVDTWDVSTTP